MALAGAIFNKKVFKPIEVFPCPLDSGLSDLIESNTK